jgi:hypothetical protein
MIHKRADEKIIRPQIQKQFFGQEQPVFVLLKTGLRLGW